MPHWFTRRFRLITFRSRDGRVWPNGGADRVQEEPHQAGPGDGDCDDDLPPEGGASDSAGHHGDQAGGLDSDGRQNRRCL